MVKQNKNHDTISETEFTEHLRGASTNPQQDSPGDSESDAGIEFQMGTNFMGPNDQMITSELVDSFEAPQNQTSTLERPKNLVPTPRESAFRVPSSVMITSSELPAPWEDKERSSSSN